VRHLLYVELRGEDAAARLRPLLDRLAHAPGFRGGELLRSPAQPDLALVQARFEHAPPDLPTPEGARAWTFVVEHALPAPDDPLE